MPEDNIKRIGIDRAAVGLTAAAPDGKSYPADAICEEILKDYQALMPIALDSVRAALQAKYPAVIIEVYWVES